jgi:hypothetical protein
VVRLRILFETCRFESLPGRWLNWLNFLKISSVPPESAGILLEIRPQPLPSTSFPIVQSVFLSATGYIPIYRQRHPPRMWTPTSI